MVKEGIEMDYDEIMMNAEERMENALEALGNAFASVRTGRANAKVLDRIKVDYYGAMTPINQLAGVKTPNARLLVIEPWDKSALKAIERALQESDLGVMPSNDGTVIRLPFPELTEERRRELQKNVQKMGEESKVAIRNIRRDANDAIKKMKKEGTITEDEIKLSEKEVQDVTDKYIKQVESIVSAKEKAIMHI